LEADKKIVKLEGRLNNLVSNLSKKSQQEKMLARQREQSTCSTCSGTHIVVCRRCSGRGTVYNDYGYGRSGYYECRECSGRGSRPCLDCLSAR
jgi:DnaJ-class molecular chaperone